MAFCSSCGTEVAGAAFCPKCGQAQTGGAVTQSSQSADSGMAENVAALLCYVLGWVTGIIFLLIDKRPAVKFHAAQSIVVFGGLTLIHFAIGFMLGAGAMMGAAGALGAFGLAAMLSGVISLVGLILWILLMVKAYQGQKFEVPIAAGIAKSIAGK
jgi:uncharacterized membrane protein